MFENINIIQSSIYLGLFATGYFIGLKGHKKLKKSIELKEEGIKEVQNIKNKAYLEKQKEWAVLEGVKQADREHARHELGETAKDLLRAIKRVIK